ncbi:unnamed protein product [Clonostachys byssicola]|uniref:NmrA-like domain-containing protein n=1 Tax=Clonostachys byssicola TaxID=160290 RepID=A0A9N9UIQ5_9HYPO|nr:unnamed protein product [Clonostachys byssicola]
MVRIAVAGGAGQVGKSIVEGLVAHGGHEVYVFSRSSREPSTGIKYLTVDYSSFASVQKALDEAQINTLVCAIGVVNEEANASQLRLIQAAASSEHTKRFIIASYDLLHKKEHIELNPLAKYTFQAVDELEKTNLEYTRIANGWFLDYFGMPHWKTTLHPWINVLNMEQKWAVIPGDGSAKATFITTQDMAKFLARMMDLEKWSKVTLIFGETLSFKDLLQLAEEVRGKFEVAYDDLDALKGGKISFASRFPPIGFPDDEAFFALLHYLAGLGQFSVPSDDTLNEKFPDIRITTTREVMEASWKGK